MSRDAIQNKCRYLNHVQRRGYTDLRREIAWEYARDGRWMEKAVARAEKLVARSRGIELFSSRGGKREEWIDNLKQRVKAETDAITAIPAPSPQLSSMPRPVPPAWLKNAAVLISIRVALPYLKEKLRRRSPEGSAASQDAPTAVKKGISNYDVLAVTALGFRPGSCPPFPMHDPAAHTTAYARALCGLFTALRRPSSQTSPASLDSSDDSTRQIAGEKSISPCDLLLANKAFRPGSCPPFPVHGAAAHTSAYTRSLCGLCATRGAAKDAKKVSIPFIPAPVDSPFCYRPESIDQILNPTVTHLSTRSFFD
ncbi:hypothetical protein BDZ89DRAFT_1046323 [Hymenopellis radicata]|nr:hypothetical protein BDZ89DRAFT_1046323 [Hymenopellis radicata]